MPTTWYPPTCAQGQILNEFIYISGQDGDTIILPPGDVTWGASSTPYWLTNSITLAATGSTIIRIADDAPSFAGTINLWAPCIISGLTIVGSQNVAGKAAFSPALYTGRGDGWRITHCTYSGTNQSDSYFALCRDSYGVIDNNTIIGGNGSSELIFARGPTNSWQTPANYGTSGAVFIENNIFDGTGYVCDANSNSRMVVRYNTIRSKMKVDGHGVASNSPARGVRWMEVYGNNWTTQGVGAALLELRGGGLRVFNNTTNNSAENGDYFFLTDYGYLGQWPNFNYIYQTPTNYPILDQIGLGSDPKVAGSEPAYIWGNKKAGSSWTRNLQPIGLIDITTNASGYASGVIDVGINSLNTTVHSGNAFAFTGDNTRYLLDQTKFQTSLNLNNLIPPLQVAIPATSIAVKAGPQINYQLQTSNPNAQFTERDIIQSNRDFYADAGFDTHTGVSIGTTAEMNALTPTVTGYGFWVIDQGSWNKTIPANTAGLLYTWSGGWNLTYIPYQYPYYWTDSSGTSGVTYTLKRLGSNIRLKGFVEVSE